MEFVKRHGFILLLGLILMLQLFAASAFCARKQGFHYDEYYSYYSSNVTYGLVPTDREWKDTAEIRSEFVVEEGEGFQYGTVKLMQSYDVHPPLYYMILHTVCSLFPDTFTKWTGLGLNLCFFAIAYVLLAVIACQLSRGNRLLTLFACILFGFQPGVISGITFIRMYMLLTVWCMAVMAWHIRRFEQERFLRPGAMAGLMALTFLGFLTHYYFAVFLFFVAAFTCLYLWWARKQLKAALCYGITVCAGLGLAVLYYPSCLGHIFRGYRGTEAVGAFFDLSNTFLRLGFFTELMDRSVFGGAFSLAVLLLLVLGIAVFYVKRKEQRMTAVWRLPGRYPGFFLLLFTTLGYFLVVAKTALLNAEEASRYELPVYGFCMLLTLLLLYFGGRYLLGRLPNGQLLNRQLPARWSSGGEWKVWVSRLGYTAIVLVFLWAQKQSLQAGQVQFLYESDREHVDWARTQSKEAVIYLYHPANVWMIWDESEELMQYEEIYFVSLADTSPAQDDRLAEAERVYVYASRLPEVSDMIKQMQEEYPHLQECEKIRELLYCDLYTVF